VFFRAPAVVCFCIFAIACSRKPAEPSVTKMAVLRFENLGPDTGTDWIGRAFSEVLTAELSGSPLLSVIPSSRMRGYQAALGVEPASAPGISAERPAALALGATEILYGDYVARPGRIDVRVTIEDPTTRRMTRVLSASAADVYDAATALALRVSPSVLPYSTRNTEALRAYAVAVDAAPDAAVPKLEEAIAADPNFGPAYEMLAALKARQDLAGATAVLKSALARGDALGAYESARIRVQLANFGGDRAARIQALTALTSAAPRDPAAWRSLADNLMAAHDYAKSASAYRGAVGLDPTDVAAWNQLGYASAYAGDLPAALDALRRYQALRPADPNPIDSMGDVSVVSGKLREAEEYYLAAEKKAPGFRNHGDLFKAAMARLMTGDIAGAGVLAKQYADARAAAHDPQAPLLAAEWAWLSGRRRQACREMEETAAGAPQPLAARAYSELSIWYLMLGDRAAAAAAAAKAQPTAAAAIPRFLLQPSAPPAEWIRRTSELPGPLPVRLRETLAGVALVFNRDFAAASPFWKALYETGDPGDDPSAPVALAWTLLETGNPRDAAALLRWNPIPTAAGPGALVSLYFPRVYYLRAPTGGSNDAAKANYRLFLQLSGPDPLVWGEEEKARAATK
jgi:tetratricopeptide (TPR) repeat protein